MYRIDRELERVTFGIAGGCGRLIGHKLFDFFWAASWLALLILLTEGIPIILALLGALLISVFGLPYTLIEIFEERTRADILDSTPRTFVAAGIVWSGLFTLGVTSTLGLVKLIELDAGAWLLVSLGLCLATLVLPLGTLLVMTHHFSGGSLDDWNQSEGFGGGGIQLGELLDDEWDWV